MNGGGRILLVDDSAATRSELSAALEAEGHTVIQTTNGRDALRILGVGDGDDPAAVGTVADVVLLDLTIPELDGLGVLEAIKTDVDVGHVPVIVVSDEGDREGIVRSIQLGAADFITKPFDAPVLAARVHASLVEKRLRDVELVYMEDVERLTDAAAALEAGRFDAEQLAAVTRRDDALGRLARTFSGMASEVAAREERLRAEVRELRIEIDEARQARQVKEITGSEYFRDLRARAADLRRSVEE